MDTQLSRNILTYQHDQSIFSKFGIEKIRKHRKCGLNWARHGILDDLKFVRRKYDNETANHQSAALNRKLTIQWSNYFEIANKSNAMDTNMRKHNDILVSSCTLAVLVQNFLLLLAMIYTHPTIASQDVNRSGLLHLKPKTAVVGMMPVEVNSIANTCRMNFIIKLT